MDPMGNAICQVTFRHSSTCPSKAFQLVHESMDTCCNPVSNKVSGEIFKFAVGHKLKQRSSSFSSHSLQEQSNHVGQCKRN